MKYPSEAGLLTGRKFIFFGLLFLFSCSKTHYLTNIDEIDTRFFIDSKNDVYFSNKNGDQYQIMTWQNNSASVVISTKHDLFNPFCYKNEVCALYDNNGDENWQTTQPELNAQLINRYIERIESDKAGNWIVFQPKNTFELLFLDVRTGYIQKLGDINTRYHNTVFDSENQQIIISLDNRIIVYNLNPKEVKTLLDGVLGEKRNIFLSGSDLYFNSNDVSEYHQIYKYSLSGNNAKPVLVYSDTSDVMMPQIINGDLYFIQCVRNHYQLKRRSSNETVFITKTGVVYQYSYFKDNSILFSYSDFNLPMALMQYHIQENKIVRLTGETSKLGIKYIYQPMSDGLSPAYRIILNGKKKGVILFFHPGLNGDFSPRWDTILMNLAKNGYEIVCPNYPMSFGYGKRYNKAPFQDAVMDMRGWKDRIIKESDDIPLFLLSASSGNLLSDAVLYFDNQGVDGAISLFGFYNPRIPLADVQQLIVLGKNDPRVIFEDRTTQVLISSKRNIKYFSLINEGHWIRYDHNNARILDVIIAYITNICN